MKSSPLWICLLLALLSSATAGRTRNGNELALELSTLAGDERTERVADSLQHAFYFRYLLITNFVEKSTNGQSCVAIDAVEPSSDLTVRFVVRKAVSMQKLKELPIGKGDAVAITGRLAECDLDQGVLVIDPVIVRHKDKRSPSAGKELLHEIDPNARTATDTSSGKEVVTRPSGVTTNRAPRAARP